MSERDHSKIPLLVSDPEAWADLLSEDTGQSPSPEIPGSIIEAGKRALGIPDSSAVEQVGNGSLIVAIQEIGLLSRSSKGADVVSIRTSKNRKPKPLNVNCVVDGNETITLTIIRLIEEADGSLTVKEHDMTIHPDAT